MVPTDYATIVSALADAYPHGSTFEVRALSRSKNRIQLGYFNAVDVAANAIALLDNEGIAGIYSTLNPVLPDLRARANNRFVDALTGGGTKDTEIPLRCGLLVDIDPVRPANISSTDAEHEAAITHARYIRERMMYDYGWPPAALIDSGNGAHLRWFIKADNSDYHTKLIKASLAVFDNLFSTETLHIDKSVFNASRIVRIPGTTARKGDELDDRRHRMSVILEPFDEMSYLTLGKLVHFVSHHEETATELLNGHHTKVFPYPDDEKIYSSLNRVAKERIHDWVPHLLPGVATPYGDGYRMYSPDLGRDLQEAVSIRPEGIKDFGVHDLGDPMEGRRTPVSLIAEWVTNGDKREAARLISTTLGVYISEFGEIPSTLTGIEDFLGDTQIPVQEIEGHTLYDLIQLLPKFAPAEYLVGNYMEVGDYVNIQGFPKSGKSTMARQLALCIASGIPFLGDEVKRGKVIYVGYEEKMTKFIKNMQSTLMWLMEQEQVYLPQSEIDEVCKRIEIFAVPSRFKTEDQEGKQLEFKRIEQQIKKIPKGLPGLEALQAKAQADPEVIVIFMDPMTVLFEDEPLHPKPLIADRKQGEALKRVAQLSDTAMILIDHTSKHGGSSRMSDIDPSALTSSTAQKAATADILITLHRGYMDADGSKEYGKLNGKGRCDPIDRFLHLHHPFGWVAKPDNIELVELGKGTPGAPKRYPALNLMVDTQLRRNGIMTLNDLVMVLNIPKQIVYREIQRQIEAGRLGIDTDSKQHRYWLVETNGIPELLAGGGLLDVL